MADEPAENKVRSDENDQAKNEQNSMSKDEIDQLSDMISDCMASTSQEDDQDTGPFATSTEEDTGEFKPVQDVE